MKEILFNLALFVVLCIAFSGLNACTSSEPLDTMSDASNSAANSNVPVTVVKSSDYPPLASALAESEFELLDGTPMKLSDKKGKVLLATIWGTWCGPCRAEMPFLIQLQDKYRDQGLEVIGLNIGDGNGIPESIDDINKFVDKMKLNYTIARSPNAATGEFYKLTKQQVVPQSIMVDREGRLRGVFIGGGPKIANSIQQTLDRTLAE